ncbi:uncharacterized protein DNG_02996 [Cephalotrichum gorgonifer]|uniref:Uncharacterized protein n=1 Tax=Cephalotrichum gorgonifer TaxID=2041049 RepID=A0AAE8MTF2_9PEZI|nr:uncharacterized protein DNG_02996 [Cephalotrichum gorgonifer]
MAMDALKNISNNVPDWLQRLGELNGQIEQRQRELVALGQSSTKSIRNRGSNESLLTKDEDEVEAPVKPSADIELADTPAEAAAAPEPAQESSNTPAITSTELKQHTRDVVKVAHAHALAQVRKQRRSQSVTSEEGHPAAYRSRRMIVVYYDSFVESFFEELVKFVSASRNLMRKAKMAAKVAHIKRMADLDVGNDDGDDDDNSGMPPRPLPSLRYLGAGRGTGMSPSLARMTAGVGGRGAGPADPASDFYDKLDKGLEYVQSTSERAAHQFLRDGDCAEEVNNIARRLAETKELAEKEIERIMRENPELANEPAEAQKVRTHRPPAVRRELNSAKESLAAGEAREAKQQPVKRNFAGLIEPNSGSNQILEADDNDEGLGDMDFKMPARIIRRAGAARTNALEVDP